MYVCVCDARAHIYIHIYIITFLLKTKLMNKFFSPNKKYTIDLNFFLNRGSCI